MPSAPITMTRAGDDPAGKIRPITHTRLDLHALGLRDLDGVPLPRYVAVEPGALLELVLVADRVILAELDPLAPTLLSGPVLLVSDSAGADGEVAVATLQG